KLMDNYSRLDPFSPRYQDVGARTLSGTKPRDWNQQNRPQTSGSLSYFKRGWGTSHNFKVGWEVAQKQTPAEFHGLRSRNNGDSSLPDLVYILNNGAPSQVRFNLTPAGPFLSYQWTHS